MQMTRRNIVTGGRGLLGGAIVDKLEAAGREVVSLSSDDCDLRDYDATLRLFTDLKPAIVFHAAAKVHGLMGNREFPGEMFSDNVRINLNVIDACRATGVEKIVAVSTVATYSSDIPLPVKPESIWDGPPHASEAAYGHAKRAMLAQLGAYSQQYGMKFAYALMTNIYGPRDRFDTQYGHVIPSLIAKFFAASRSGEPVKIWGSGRAERDFIYSEDAATALLAIADGFEGALNVATGEITSIKDVVGKMQQISGVEQVEWDRTKPDGQLLRRYDVQPLAELGFQPAFTLLEGLANTYEWYSRNNGSARK
ncbi:MAG: NAD-dependent epimerase/dehydratase family protein [Cytophagaceae bacterium]|nr:MAG: NAD-dependent epimerase/dehydratase family protein [Cytophagaceae bacterium]